MQKRRLVFLALIAAVLASSEVGAEPRTFWDDGTQAWVTADAKSSAFRRASRGRIPREMVEFAGPYSSGSLIVDTEARRLYYVMSPGKAVRYGIGVGREGYQWSGTDFVSNKAEWPTWKPPAEMIEREKKRGHILEEVMPGGPDNPLGARALYIGFGLYRIHGTPDPASIGRAVSSGCIRLTNEDVIDLYDRVRIGTRVVVLLQSPKLVVAKAEPAVVAASPSPVVVPKPRLNPLALRVVARAAAPVKQSPKPILVLKNPDKPPTALKKPGTILAAKSAAKTPEKKAKPLAVATVETRQKDDLLTASDTAPMPVAAATPVQNDAAAELLAALVAPQTESETASSPSASH